MEDPPDPQQEIIYAVSHDLRGPVLNIQGFLRRLRSGCKALDEQTEAWLLTAEQRQSWGQTWREKVERSLEVIEDNARRLEQRLEGLLELSRAGAGPLRLERFAAAEAAQQVLAQLAGVAAASQTSLRVAAMPKLNADRSRVQEMFCRLVTNAIQFVVPDRPGAVTLGGQTEGGQVICWVKDNGIGIRPHHHQSIFLPFGQVRQRPAPGVGVGLAIVQKLMRQHGGRVWVESTPGEGSTFYLAFPSSSPV